MFTDLLPKSGPGVTEYNTLQYKRVWRRHRRSQRSVNAK